MTNKREATKEGTKPFLLLFKSEDPHFHYALSSANYVVNNGERGGE